MNVAAVAADIDEDYRCYRLCSTSPLAGPLRCSPMAIAKCFYFSSSVAATLPIAMADAQPEPFICRNCGTRYELVRLEARPAFVEKRDLTCLSCGAPLPAHEGRLR
jgi:hypothetical protein